MKPPQRLVWTEGMLLGPHHFQQSDHYHEELLSHRLRALSPHDWGTLGVELDLRALQAGQVRVQRFAGVLPDGLYLSFDQADAEMPPARPLEGHFGPTRKVLEVFLGVPREREGSENYALDGKPRGRARFVSVARTVRDMTTSSSETQLPFAQRNVVLLFGDEPREDFEAMKVAEIVRDAAGGPIVRDTFVPSCLRVGASPVLVEGLKRILTLAVAKQKILSDARREREGSTVEFGAADVTRYLLVSAINTFIPVLNHVIDSADLPPRQVYLLLAQFAGQLSSFAVDSDPTSVPAFVYTDLGNTFEAMFARLTALLTSTVRENHISIPLEAREDGLHFGQFDDERVLKATQFFLAVKSTVAEAQVADQVPKLSKVASWQDIAQIVQAAAPGVPLSVTHRPPPEIPVRAGIVYFAIGTGDRVWTKLLAERKVAVYLPPPFLPAETQLQMLVIPLVERNDRTR